MEAEPVQRALQRLEQRDRRCPGQARLLGAGVGRMQRRHIGEIDRRHRHVARPVIHIAGVHGEERRLERCDFAHEPHAVLMRDAADAGDLGVERSLMSAKTVMVI
jgi:hypothetical protein